MAGLGREEEEVIPSGHHPTNLLENCQTGGKPRREYTPLDTVRFVVVVVFFSSPICYQTYWILLELNEEEEEEEEDDGFVYDRHWNSLFLFHVSS